MIIIIGCVKRMKASILLDFIENSVLTNKTDKDLIRRFAWDPNLVAAIFLDCPEPEIQFSYLQKVWMPL
jgi:hypothetical protein